MHTPRAPLHVGCNVARRTRARLAVKKKLFGFSIDNTRRAF
jgi:hypothetical protein